MKREKIQAILNQIEFPGIDFVLVQDVGRFYLVLEFTSPGYGCSESKCSGKFELPDDQDQVVRACYQAVKTSLEHEIGEKFLYNGSAVFGPHIPIQDLVKISEMVCTS